jgi:2-methylcitrate dehydratase PrpD
VREMGGAPQASIVAGGFKTTMQNAAYVNGCMALALQYDVAWYPPNHPASPTLPAIFAIAEAHHLSGAQVLEAIVVAFEVQARVRLAGDVKGFDGFLKPGTTGLFGAVASAARLLNLDRQQTLMAFGIAGSRAGGMSVNSSSMTAPTHAGHAARMGIEAAVLAKMGWTASADVFGPKGYFDTFFSGAKPQLLNEGFAKPLRMVHPGVGFKAYPCMYYTHRPIDAALTLRQQHQIEPEQIARIEIICGPNHTIDRPRPRAGNEAMYSAQYVTAVALLDGRITMDSFTHDRVAAPDVAGLLDKTTLVVDEAIPEELEKFYVTVNLTLNDGRKLSQRMDKLSGGPGNPLSREQQLSKFHSCARRALSDAAANRMLELVQNLEKVADAAEIMDIARGDQRKK